MAKYDKQTTDFFKEHGITEVLGVAKVTEDGEKRAALRLDDGSSVTLTHRGGKSGWQDAHVHYAVIEHYLVLSGWMGLAIHIKGAGLKYVARYTPAGGFVAIPDGVPHNVYLPQGTVISTVKQVLSQGYGADWEADPALQRFCDEVDERALLTHIPNTQYLTGHPTP